MLRFMLIRACRAGALAALVLASTSVAAQDSQTSRAAGATPNLGAAHEIIVHNRQVAVLRGTPLGYSPEDRADGAIERIVTILDKEGPGDVTIHEVPEGRGFAIDGEFVFFLTPQDVDPLSGETFPSIAARAMQNLELVVSEHIEQRDPKAFAVAVIHASVATLLFVGLVVLIFAANQKLRLKISSALASRAAGSRSPGCMRSISASFSGACGTW